MSELGSDEASWPWGRKHGFRLRSLLATLSSFFDVLIAGTEPITAEVMSRAKRLRLVARVGIGLDSVDLQAARARDILVSYTPDAPAPAVADTNDEKYHSSDW